MQILFTRSNSLLSRIIRGVTGEQVSHCALQAGGFVVHCNLLGLHIEEARSFKQKSTVVYTIGIVDDYTRLFLLFATYRHSQYDFGALFYLGLRYLCPWLPKVNLWQTTGMFLCTEWISKYLRGEEYSMLTPSQLYTELFIQQYKQGQGEYT